MKVQLNWGTIDIDINGIITGRCIDGEPFTFQVTRPSFDRWRNGTMIQDAFPNLTRDQREMLITGMSPAMWADMVGEGD